jgi:hypothetical protein
MKATKTGLKHGMGARGRYRPAMMGNVHPAFRAQMGIAPAVAVAVKWGLPWLLTAGGIAVTAVAAKSVFPDVPINKEKIGLAALLGGAGVTSYFLSDAIPEGWRPVSYGVAVAGIATAAYLLFTPDEPDVVTPPSIIQPPTATPGQEASKAPLGIPAGLLIELPEQQSTTGGTIRSALTEQQFEVNIVNNSDKTWQPFIGLAIYDSDGRLVWASDKRDPIYGRKQLTVHPKTGIRVNLLAPSMSGRGVGYHAIVEAQVFDKRDDDRYLYNSPNIPIDWFLWG